MHRIRMSFIALVAMILFSGEQVALSIPGLPQSPTLNPPLVTSAVRSVRITGTISALPNTEYPLELFFADPCGGDTFGLPVRITILQALTDADGKYVYDLTFPFPIGLNISSQMVFVGSPIGPRTGYFFCDTVKSSTTIKGSLTETPSSTFNVDLFYYANTISTINPSPTACQGTPQLLGSLPVTTDGDGNGNFRITLPSPPTSGFITASVSSDSGNTSEQSTCLPVTGAFSIVSLKAHKKKLLVEGEGFEDGAIVLINGREQKTKNSSANPSQLLIAKKAGKLVRAGDKIRVLNPNGLPTEEVTYLVP